MQPLAYAVLSYIGLGIIFIHPEYFISPASRNQVGEHLSCQGWPPIADPTTTMKKMKNLKKSNFMQNIKKLKLLH